MPTRLRQVVPQSTRVKPDRWFDMGPHWRLCWARRGVGVPCIANRNMAVRTPGGGKTEHRRTHLWTLMPRLHEIVVLENCIRKKIEIQLSGDQVRPGMEQPYPKPMMPWRTGVEKTGAFSCGETDVHPGNAHLLVKLEQ